MINENEGLVGASDENVQKGILRNYQLVSDHLTASIGFSISDIYYYEGILKAHVGDIVYWQEYADSGSKFTQDGKEYVLIPFYRIIGYED